MKNSQAGFDIDKSRFESDILDKAKLEVVVKEIQKIIGYEWNSLGMAGMKCTNRAVNILVGENVYNEYIKIIINNSRLGHIHDWNMKYQQFKFNDKNIKAEAIKDLIMCCKQNMDDTYNYIFWLLLVVAMDKFDFDNRVSYICDFAQIMRISDDEFEDIVNVIRYVCKVCDNSYVFKTETMKKHFENVMTIYE